MLLEVVDAAIEVWSKDRVGVRLSPFNVFNGMKDSAPVKLFTYVLQELDERGVAFVHLVEPRASLSSTQDGNIEDTPHAASLFRDAMSTVLISAGGHTPDFCL